MDGFGAKVFPSSQAKAREGKYSSAVEQSELCISLRSDFERQEEERDARPDRSIAERL